MLPHLNPELQSKYHHNLELAKKLNLGEIEEQVNKGSLFMPHNFFAYHEEVIHMLNSAFDIIKI
jgi:hypothetical protein